MIQTIIDLLDAAAGMHLSTAVRHGIAELQPVDGGTQPVVYASDGSFVQIANDNAGSLSYWRLSGRESERQVDIVGSACGGFEVTMPLRFVAMVDRALCPSVAGAARSASWAMMDVDTSIVTATDAVTVDFTGVGVDTDSRRVYQQEFGTALTSTTKAWVAIDISVVVVGQAECFAECGPSGDFLCKLIEAKTWAQIKTCLTQAQIDAAEADLCTSGTLCEVVNGADPSEVVACIENDGDVPIYLCEIIDSTAATADLIVECIGNAGKTAAVQALICEPCPMTVNVTVNGDAQPPIEDVDPCEDNTITINITYNG